MFKALPVLVILAACGCTLGPVRSTSVPQAQALIEGGRPAEARLLLTGDASPAAAYWEGVAYLKETRPVDAAASFRRALSRPLPPELTARAWKGLGDACLAVDNPAGAAAAYERALAADRTGSLPRTEVEASLKKARSSPAVAAATGDAAGATVRPLARKPHDIEAAPRPQAAPSPRTGGWCLQFGAFADPKRAAVRADTVGKVGESKARVVQIQKNGKVLNAVRAGAFPSKAGAEAARKGIADKDVIVVRGD